MIVMSGNARYLKGGGTALRRRITVKKAMLALLVLSLLLSGHSVLGETYVSEGQVILCMDAGLTLTVPASFAYIGENQGVSGFRDGDTALMLQVTGCGTMADYIAGYEGTGLSLTQEEALSTDSLQVEILWSDHPNYVAFIGAKDRQTENSPVVELVVVRNNGSLDVSGLARELAGSFRSVAEILERDQSPDSWDNYAVFTQVGLAVALPESMVFRAVLSEDGTDGYILLSNGICQIRVSFFRCTIGELAAMNGFTAPEYEIYQSNAYSLWQFRPLSAQDPAADYLAFPGSGGTWMLLAFLNTEGVDAEAVWTYVDQVMTRVIQLD